VAWRQGLSSDGDGLVGRNDEEGSKWKNGEVEGSRVNWGLRFFFGRKGEIKWEREENNI